jgi:hypothetical protein
MNCPTRWPLWITRQREGRCARKVCLGAVIFCFVLPSVALAQSSTLVISQFYGGGGEPGATFRQDYVQLFNRGTTSVDISAWTVQHMRFTGSAWSSVPLSGVIGPGEYYLIQLTSGPGGVENIPAPDAVVSLDLDLHGGRLALVSNGTVLTTPCPATADVIDFVLYGSPFGGCTEGSSMTFLSPEQAAFRLRQGCEDTDDNQTDITSGAPAPFNSSASRNPCDPESRCSLVVGSAPDRFDLSGGTGIVEIIAPEGCAWVASPIADWVVITSDRTGGGSGYLTYLVEPHHVPQGRSGGITFSGAPFGTGFDFVHLQQEAASWGSAIVGDLPCPADYDGDGNADLAVYRGPTGQWFILQSSGAGYTELHWGAPSLRDVPIPADYDGDGKADIAVYRQTTGEWFINPSSFVMGGHHQWGSPFLEDAPVPADFDGDGKADLAVYRPSSGEWFILRSSDRTAMHVQWGAAALSFGDRPVPADFDGDGKTDIAVYRSTTSEWFVRRSSDETLEYAQWGAATLEDAPVAADYDSDGKADIAVFRHVTGDWLIRRSSDGGLMEVSYGSPFSGDVPVPADYAGTETASLAVWRKSSGTWFIRP